MAKQNSSKASATVQRLRVSLLFNPSTTWLREAIKKTYETLDIVHSSDDTPFACRVFVYWQCEVQHPSARAWLYQPGSTYEDCPNNRRRGVFHLHFRIFSEPGE